MFAILTHGINKIRHQYTDITISQRPLTALILNLEIYSEDAAQVKLEFINSIPCITFRIKASTKKFKIWYSAVRICIA